MSAAPFDPHAARRSVVVTGTGTASGDPDAVRLRLEATAVRPRAGEAVDVTDDCVRRVREALAGVEAGDAVDATADSTGLTLHADETWETLPGSGRPTRSRNGFRAGHRLLVRLGSLEALSPVLTAVLDAGGDDLAVEGIEFGVADPSSLRDEARRLAWDDARSRAAGHAELAGCRLEQVVEVVEDGTLYPRPAGAVRLMSAEAGSTVEPGAVEVTCSVTVRWEMH